ncbi:unnamed protein product, partial [marine sediment metagenome]
DGYFVFTRFKRKNIFQSSPGVSPPAWTIGEVLKIVILAFTFSYIFYIGLGFFIGFLESVAQTEFEFYKNENFRMVFDTIVLDFFVFMVILWAVRILHKKRLASLGFAKKNMAKNVLYGAAGYVGIIPVIFVIGILVYFVLSALKLKPPPQPIVGLFLTEKNVALIVVSAAIAALVGPVIEELFFRGVMYNAVKRKLGVFWAIFITSVLFS